VTVAVRSVGTALALLMAIACGSSIAADNESSATDVRLLRDIPYGADPEQRMDVYLPPKTPAHAPVIFMVHGGAWRYGDKGAPSVVANKVARWVPRGFVFVSVNYRMLPKADPLVQSEDVARALAAAQIQAPSWGADPARFVLMGHSAGAHLVDLLSAAPARALDLGARPWLGAVSLDSGALDVKRIMEGPHLPLYDDAFGGKPAFWRAASPYHALTESARPALLVCSSRRSDPCPQSKAFAAKASSLGVRVEVLAEDLSHREINVRLGTPGAYTRAVEAFMASLDAGLARALAAR
jgi:acetyl esterase/lipase